MRQFLAFAIPISVVAYTFYISVPYLPNVVAVWGTSVLEQVKTVGYIIFAIRLFELWRRHGIFAFKIFSIATLIWMPGQIIQSITPISENTPYIYSNSSDIFLILAIVTVVWGVLSLGLYGLRRREKIQILVHSVTFGACVSFIATIYVTKVWLDDEQALIQSHLANYFTFSLDLILISVCLALALYRKKDPIIAAMCVGLFFQAGADLLYLASTFQGLESSRPIQRMFIWTALMFWVSSSMVKDAVPRHKGSVRSEVTLAVGSYVMVALVIIFGFTQARSLSGTSEVIIYSFLFTFVAILVSLVTGFFDSKRLVVAQQQSIQTITKSEEKYQELATHDTLTNLANRKFFIDRIKSDLNVENIVDKQFAIMFVDLDRFKEVNDTYGHQAGDRVIKELAQRIESVMDDSGMVCRLGGDEFAIFIQIEGETSKAKELASRVLKTCTEPLIVQGTENYISCSIGIAYNTSKDSDSQSLLRNADAAMYRAKELGRNRIEECVSTVELKSTDNAWTLNELHRAIADDQIEVHYQPIIEMSSQEIVGFEALARWAHPKIGMIPPDSFIAVAEDNGLIIELGNKVIRKSIGQLSAWQSQQSLNRVPLMMNVNLSFRQLSDENLIDFINTQCDFYGVSPTSIVFEMTESALLGDIKNAISTLKEIQSYGFQIQIDDFGTGYSSLSYLKKFPVAGFKIDKSYIQGYGTNEDDTAIVDALVGLGKSMDLVVTAEGVDSRETHAALVRMGCTFAQGHLYSMAIPASEVILGDLGENPKFSNQNSDRKSA